MFRQIRICSYFCYAVEIQQAATKKQNTGTDPSVGCPEVFVMLR